MTRVYKFLPEEWALDDIEKQHIKISRICDLNDPFELIPFDLTDKEQPDAQIRTRTELFSGRGIGMLCFSFKWLNPVLWAHYADKHKGICLGFDLPDGCIRKVCYVRKRKRLPSDWNKDEKTSLKWAKRMLFTKFHGWAYEDEYRVFVKLDPEEEDENGNYHVDFKESHMTLREAILGCECPFPESVEGRVLITRLQSRLEPYDEEVKLIRARPSDESFTMIENTAVCL